MSGTFESIQQEGKDLMDKCLMSIKNKMHNKEDFDKSSEILVDNMVDELMLEFVAEYHKAMARGYVNKLLCKRNLDNESNNLSEESHPVIVLNKPEIVKCPLCPRKISSSVYASHVEGCFDKKNGLPLRNSSRLASKRAATKVVTYNPAPSDDDNDERNVSLNKTKLLKKFEQCKKKSRKIKCQKIDSSPKGKEEVKSREENSKSSKGKVCRKSDEDNSEDCWLSSNKFMHLLTENRVKLLSSKCVVKSRTNGKFCGRSIKCTVHTDTERAAIRKCFSFDDSNYTDTGVDFEEIDSVSSKHEVESSCTPSPSDSTSSSTGSSSKKKTKQKHRGSKGKHSFEPYSLAIKSSAS